MQKKIYNLCVIILVVSFFFACPPFTQAGTFNNITWNVKLNCTGTEGTYDFVFFGEAPDANDGPPADAHDMVKPPAPMPPYIRAWFNDSLPSPYHLLWGDYRRFPDTKKIWNLTVQWMPSSGSSPMTMTIHWDIDEFDDSEYDLIFFCTEQETQLVNMLVSNHYTFSCPAYIPQYFKIICEVNTPPEKPQKPSGPTSGEPGVEYTYSTTTTDPNNQELYYQWNWGDGTTSDWLGPYEPAQNAEAQHTWSKKGNYEIKVKAKDTCDAESPWSEPLPITMPTSHDDIAGVTVTHMPLIIRTPFIFNSIIMNSGWLIRLIYLILDTDYCKPI